LQNDIQGGKAAREYQQAHSDKHYAAYLANQRKIRAKPLGGNEKAVKKRRRQ